MLEFQYIILIVIITNELSLIHFCGHFVFTYARARGKGKEDLGGRKFFTFGTLKIQIYLKKIQM